MAAVFLLIHLLCFVRYNVLGQYETADIYVLFVCGRFFLLHFSLVL